MDCPGGMGLVNVGADLISITLPWPPSVNRIWRSVGGRVLLSAAGRTYRQAVAVAVLEQHGAGDPLTGRLSMTIRAYPPDRRRRDLDNLLKAILDSLEHAGSVYVNDSQIDHLSIHRCAVEVGCRLEIQIWEHETDG
jgi:crossover junction endodeoxyribonuclease RusA